MPLAERAWTSLPQCLRPLTPLLQQHQTMPSALMHVQRAQVRPWLAQGPSSQTVGVGRPTAALWWRLHVLLGSMADVVPPVIDLTMPAAAHILFPVNPHRNFPASCLGACRGLRSPAGFLSSLGRPVPHPHLGDAPPHAGHPARLQALRLSAGCRLCAPSIFRGPFRPLGAGQLTQGTAGVSRLGPCAARWPACCRQLCPGLAGLAQAGLCKVPDPSGQP